MVRWSSTLWILAGFLLAAFAYLLIQGPLLTNDGPAHLHFADFLWRSMAGQDRFQARIYAAAPGLGSNTVSEDLLAVLIPVVGPLRAEAIIQAACLSLPPLAAAWAFHALRPGSSWVAVSMLPLMFQQLLFLGLYNYILSIAGFFAVLAIYLSASPGRPWTLAALAAALVLTLFLHPMGFIAAALALIVFEGVRAVRDLINGRTPIRVIIQGLPYAAMVGAASGLLALLSSPAGGADYGLGPKRRLVYLLQLKLLWINGPGAAGYILILGLTFAGFLLLLAHRGRRNRKELSQQPTLEAIVLFCVFGVVSLAFPDTLGGGWTHFRRAALLPMIGALFVIASLRWTDRVRLFAVGAWLIAGLGLALNAIGVQREAREEEQDYRAASALVGERCSVAPVIFSRWLTKGPLADIDLGYEPFYQEASRWSVGSDRLVLFDFLARLGIYPVRLQPGRDPQQLLYGWRPRRHETEIDHLDIKTFEDAAGVPVDYILLRYDGRTPLTSDQSKLLRSVRRLAGGPFTVAFKSEDGALTLLKRAGAGAGCSSRL